jgi:hypothetical protein
MSRPRISWIPFTRVAAVLAVAFGVGLGCVMLGSVFAVPAPCVTNCEKFDVGPLAGVGLVLMFFSAIGLLITIIVFLLTKMIESLSFERAGSETIRLFDDAEVDDKPKG